MKSAMAQPANGQPGQCGITASDGGAITGHITWNGGSANTPTPSAAIVMETSAATWSGTVGDSPDFVFTPDSTAGLGSGVTAVFSQNGQTYYPDGGSYPSSKSYTGVKYSAATSGSSSTTTCSPSFVLSGTTGINYDSYEYCSMMYTYTASASPVTINLDGATPDSNGNLNILVGQGCTASLVGIPSTCTVSNYNWTIPGNTFQSWNGDSGSSDVAADTGPGLTNQPTAHWYWNDTAGNKTVTCTATVTPPSGQGSPFTLTIIQQVNLQRPTWTARNYGGYGYIIHSSAVYVLRALPTPFMLNQGFEEGSTWHTTVSTPPLFSNGQFGYASIITPGEYLTLNGGTEQALPEAGQMELDGQFPYLGATYSADGMPHDEGDSPALPFGSVQFPADNFQYVRLADTFKTYLMFKPGSGDAQWVPLAESDWHTAMGTYRPIDHPPLKGHWSDFPSTQPVGGVSVDSDFTPQTIHPSWNQVSSQSHG